MVSFDLPVSPRNDVLTATRHIFLTVYPQPPPPCTFDIHTRFMLTDTTRKVTTLPFLHPPSRLALAALLRECGLRFFFWEGGYTDGIYHAAVEEFPFSVGPYDCFGCFTRYLACTCAFDIAMSQAAYGVFQMCVMYHFLANHPHLADEIFSTVWKGSVGSFFRGIYTSMIIPDTYVFNDLGTCIGKEQPIKYMCKITTPNDTWMLLDV